MASNFVWARLAGRELHNKGVLTLFPKLVLLHISKQYCQDVCQQKLEDEEPEEPVAGGEKPWGP